MTLEHALNQIIDFKENYEVRDSKEVLSILLKYKAEFKEKSDSDSYSELMLWLHVFKAQEAYLNCYRHAKAKKYYEAWCAIETGLNCLEDLKAVSETVKDPGSVNFIREKFKKLQKLFPYKVFGSPEFTFKRKCSICKEYITFRKKCEHVPGEIYSGQLCDVLTTDFEFHSLALVQNPVQKYSVPFGKLKKTGERVDHYNYKILELLYHAIQSPFEEWSFEWQTREIKSSQLTDQALTQDCPCGSNSKYEICCYGKPLITIPHLQFIFSPEAHIRLKKDPPKLTPKPDYELDNVFEIAFFKADDPDLI